MREYMNTLIPHVLERSGNSEVSYDLYSRLLKDRIIFVDGEIVDETADLVVAQILYLESENQKIRTRISIFTSTAREVLLLLGSQFMTPCSTSSAISRLSAWDRLPAWALSCLQAVPSESAMHCPQAA